MILELPPSFFTGLIFCFHWLFFEGEGNAFFTVTPLHLHFIQYNQNKNTKLCSSLFRKPQNQSLPAVSIKSNLSIFVMCVLNYRCMFSQAPSSCLTNKSKVKTSSLPSPPRALRQLTKTTPGMIFHFHSTSEESYLSSVMFSKSGLMTNTLVKGS